MPEDPTPNPAPAPENNPAPTPEPPDPTKSFTQEQLDRIVGKEKSTAATAAEKAALQKLSDDTGLSIDQLKELAKSDKDRQDKEKTDLQRAQDEAARIERETSEKLTTAQMEMHAERVKNQLLRANVPLPEDDAKADEALNSLVKLVSAQPGASVEDIRTSIGQLKEQFPALFTAPEVTPTGNPPSNPPGNPRKPLLGTSNPSEIGSSRADQANARRGVTKTTA